MADNLEYKCPCCGGALAFDTKIQKMKCPYCDSEYEMDSLKHMDEGLVDVQSSTESTSTTYSTEEWQEDDEQMNVFICNSCGGQLIADENTAATACPYCDNPVVLKERLVGDLKPELVIPFKLDKKAAKEALNKHLRGKWLLPKIFKDQNHIDEVKGVYVPFWLFDTEADADIKYKATIVTTWSDEDYDYTKTDFYSVLRSGQLTFSHLPVDGSSNMDDTLMESIEPFDFSEAVAFQTAYLAGYLADRYDVTEEESIEHANLRAKRSTEDSFAATVEGFTTVTPESSNVRFKNSKAQYVLYPVWLLNTTWNNEKYVFAMNGQTGKFVGNLPMDKQAYWRYYAAIAAVASVACYGIAWLVHLM